ncbi:MAG: glycosyltransferase [Pseudomonadota bacterium]
MTADAAASPRVTLIIVAFNQEAFIPAAIAGAFAQDYPNLEVILSDDGSTDSTWPLIQRAAADYQGSHDVSANQTPANHGLLAHIVHAFGKATGELIVIGAGDDVSLPARVATLARRWRETGADALYSDWQVIDESGAVVYEGGRRDTPPTARWFADGRMTAVAGATAAYSRALLEAIEVPTFPIFIEDFFLSFVLRLRSRRVERIDAALVQYRRHSASLINRPLESDDVLAEERRLERFAHSTIPLGRHMLSMARTGAGVRADFGVPAQLDWRRFEADLRHSFFRADWIDRPWYARLAELGRQRSTANLRWLVPRLGGLRTLRWQRRISALLRGRP